MPNLLPHGLRRGAGAAATWTPSFLLLPALSRAEPEFLIIKAKPEGCYPNRPAGGTRRGSGNHTTKSVLPSDKTHRRPSSAFFVFDEKESKSLDLRKRFPSPAASPSLRRAFPLMVGGSIPYLNLAGILSSLIQIGGWVWFEHRLKHDLKVLATPCVQYKIWKAAEMTKRGRFPMLH